MLETFLQAIDNLRAHKLRTFLTMFGIMWGVISIVVLSAMSEGFLQGNLSVMQELGKNIVIVRNGRTSLQAGGERAGRLVRLTLGDAQALQAQARLLEHVSPELMKGDVRVKSAYTDAVLQMSGIWPVFQEIRTIDVAEGRLLTEADEADARRVVVIGHEASQQLFEDRSPIGAELQLNGLTYVVVGRIRKKLQDSNYTGQDDYRLFVPYGRMRRDFPIPGASNSADSLSAIIVSSRPSVVARIGEELAAARGGAFGLMGQTSVDREIRQVLAPRHDFDPADTEALSLWNTAIESVMFDKMISGMRDFFLAVSVVTLILGGIGVMNIMLVAVGERTQEIGLRKALGASARTILRQFVLEGLVLTGVSGVLGFASAVLLCDLINQAPMPARFSGMIVTPGTGVFAMAALTLVGLLATIYPASRAAALPPVEAIRQE